MTVNHAHTPNLNNFRRQYQLLARNYFTTERALDAAMAEFDLVIAAAEQRGAVRAFKESANEVRRELRWQYEQNINRNSDTGDSIDRLLELEKVFKYRADQMEGDDETH